MRRGEEFAESGGDGDSQLDALTWVVEEPRPAVSCKTGNVETATGEKEKPCIGAACTNAACIDGIVLQQSWLCSALWEEQGIVSQHRIASSAEAIGAQSIA